MGHRGRRLASGLGVVGVTALAGGWIAALPALATAPGEFGAPLALRAASPAQSQSPAVSVTASGRVAAAWTQESVVRGPYGVVLRRGSASGAFGPLERVTGEGSSPAIAAGRGGGAAVVWDSFARPGGARYLEASVAIGHGHFGRPQVLAGVRAGIGPQEVFASGGRYVAVWSQGVPATASHAVMYAVSNAAGHFGAARTLTRSTATGGLSAAAGTDGTVTVAWRAPPSAVAADTGQLVYAQLAPGASTFGGPHTVPAAAADNGSGSGVFAGPGGTALTWTEAVPGTESLAEAAVAAGVSPTPQLVFALPSADSGKLYTVGPAVALPGGGLPAVAAFAVLGSPGGDSSDVVSAGTVFAAQAGPDGTFAAPVELSDLGTLATQPVAAATSSDAVVAWTVGSFPKYGLKYAVRAGSGSFGDPQSLSPRRGAGPVVLAASSGAVVAAWVSGAGPNQLGIDLAILRDAG
jgi:hypothetical protein